MPVIDQSAVATRPFFPADAGPASAARSASAPANSATPETVTVTASRGQQEGDHKTFLENLLDIVNPLEHLPIVSTIYSNLTGDKPQDMEQLAGDTIYGGPMGFASSLGNILFTKITGKSIGDTVWGWLTDRDEPSQPATASAQAAPSAAAAGASAKAQTAQPREYHTTLSDFAMLQAEIAAASQQHHHKPAASDAPDNGPSNAPVAAAAPTPAVTVPFYMQPVQAQPVTPAPAQAAADTPVASIATGVPRILNPLPPRGVPPAMHGSGPSETRRAQGMAAMIAKRANLKVPSSEARPVVSFAPASAPQANSDTNRQPAAPDRKPQNVSVGSDGVPTLDSDGEKALLAAINQNGIAGDLGQRALMAYQKTMAMTPDPANAAALQSAATLH